MAEKVLISFEHAKLYLETRPQSGLWYDYGHDQARRWWITPDVNNGQLCDGFLMGPQAQALIDANVVVRVRLMTHKRRVVYEANTKCRVCGCSEFYACPGGCAWTRGANGHRTNVCSRCAE